MRFTCAILISALASSPAAAICFPSSGSGCFDAPGVYTPLVNPYPSHERLQSVSPTVSPLPPVYGDSGINMLLKMQEIELLDRSQPVYAPLGWPRRN